jgi:hypothetical protein
MKFYILIKSILLLAFLFVAGISFSNAAPLDCEIVVSGAAWAGVDGTYAISGSFNGTPTYSSAGFHVFRSTFNIGEWEIADQITNNSGAPNQLYYNYNLGTPFSVPSTGWQALGGVLGSIPTISSNPCPKTHINNNGVTVSARRTWYYRPLGITDKQVQEGNTSLWLKGGAAGANFSAGVCLQKCTVNSGVPAGAKKALPGKGVIATLYVRVVNEGGEPGNGAYRACFANPDLNDVVIYQFISGVWTPVMYGTASTFCAPAMGDGAFYLGAG